MSDNFFLTKLFDMLAIQDGSLTLHRFTDEDTVHTKRGHWNGGPWGREKSWSRTHYRTHKFPVPFGDICIPNGLCLKLLDKVSYGWVREQTEKPTIKLMCTIQLPPGPHSNLQFTLNSSSHTQNIAPPEQNLAGDARESDAQDGPKVPQNDEPRESSTCLHL
jgi:hypothetical protein